MRASQEKWRILVVDDEDDVHAVTKLALRRRTWKDRPFEVVSARSAAEGKEALKARDDGESFHVALVDVVMESPDAGLDLCEHIRKTQPRSLRIVLRTGQPGTAPEEHVLNEFDIDYYLAKAEVTHERLFATLRACLRSSQDVSTIMAVSDQLQSYVGTIQRDESVERLVESFASTLAFLESKYSIGVGLVAELAEGDESACFGPHLQALIDAGDATIATFRKGARAAANKGQFETTRDGNVLYIPFRFAPADAAPGKRKGFLEALSKLLGPSAGHIASGCVVVRAGETLAERALAPIVYDVRLFCENWRLTYQLLCSQKAMAAALAGSRTW